MSESTKEFRAVLDKLHSDLEAAKRKRALKSPGGAKEEGSAGAAPASRKARPRRIAYAIIAASVVAGCCAALGWWPVAVILWSLSIGVLAWWISTEAPVHGEIESIEAKIQRLERRVSLLGKIGSDAGESKDLQEELQEVRVLYESLLRVIQADDSGSREASE